MQVEYEYDQDPRYGWASINMGDKKDGLIVVHSENHGSLGFMFSNGEMKPTCICQAHHQYECSCPNVNWNEE